MSNNWIPDEQPVIPLTVARAEDINRRYENVVSAMDKLPEPAASGKGFAPPVEPQDPANRQFVMDVLSSGQDAFVQANRSEAEADRSETQANLSDQHRIAALNSQNSAAGSASTATTQAGVATTQAGISTTQASNSTIEANRARDEADRSESEADRAQGFANGLDIPSATGNGGKYLKQKNDESGLEYDVSVPSGGIIMWSGSIATIPGGFLKCNGAQISRTLYADLFQIIGTTYGAGNGSSTFNIPDLRGEFIRGHDDGRGVDSGRVMGSWQDHALQQHGHTTNANRGSSSTPGGAYTISARTAATVTNVTGANTAAETRPRNVALTAFIKY